VPKDNSCVARIYVFEISGRGSRQLNVICRSFVVQGLDSAGREFSKVQVIHMNQREKIAVQDRRPDFRSGLVLRLSHSTRMVQNEIFNRDRVVLSSPLNPRNEEYVFSVLL